ncbi:MAG: hypothetical protein J6Y43_01020 [Clostridia bacterium]|nr:hypothetical protein [Clostridia bacterium]
MTKEDKFSLMISSIVDSYYEHCPDSLNVYFKNMKDSLDNCDYSTIEFCVEKICDEYNAYNNGSYKDLTELLSELHNYNLIAKENKKEREGLYKFWVSFTEWYNKQKEELSYMFANNYRYGRYNDPINKTGFKCHQIRCNEASHYKIEYGEEYIEPNINTISLNKVKNYIELIYSKFLRGGKEGKYEFVVQVNKTFSRLGLPYKLDKGKIKKQGYKSSFLQDKILNYEQFERKIAFSEEMILHKDLMDKHAALEYIADAFCYFYSLFKKDGNVKEELEDKKVNAKIATLIHNDNSDKQYLLFKDEIEEVKKIINDNFDIRHNEYYRKSDKVKREVLSDIYVIEYLYNRIYSLLYIFRLKYKPEKNAIPEILGDDLPF